MLLAGLLVLAACSSSRADQAADDAAVAPATTAVAAEETTTDPEVVGDEQEAESDEAEQGSQEPASSEAPPPVEAYDPDAEPVSDVETDPTTAWISRRSMSAERVEVVWSAPEGAAEYQIHRVLWEDRAEPDGSVMTADNLITTGDVVGSFVDDDVTDGEQYWYGVRGVDADGNAISVGWHWVAAVTDDQPPSKVPLSAQQPDVSSVLVSWSEPEENYQMHGYRILRAVGDSEPEVVATTWDLNQMSFLDSDPPSGTVTYSVVAFDFHWNDSEPAEVTLELP